MPGAVEVVEPAAESIEVLPSAPIAKKSKEELAAIRTQALEDAVFQSAAEVVAATQAFADIDENAEAPPEAWLEELDGDMAAVEKRFRLAKAAWKGPKDAPMGMHVAKSIYTQLAKVRSERLAPKQLNVVAIVVNTQGNAYPEQEME